MKNNAKLHMVETNMKSCNTKSCKSRLFAKKLDAIMKLTEMSNSRMAQLAPLSSSYISRLRTDRRPLPSQPVFLPSVAQALASVIFRTGKTQAVAKLLGDRPDKVWNDERELANDIAEWFIDDTPVPEEPPKIPPPVSAGQYLGNEGKRAATERFLLEVIEAPKPRTLFLYSDESMEWMIEDPEFIRRWSELMEKTARNGNKFVIIHTIKRNFDEIFHAISRWMPLYLSGAIESYYCPKVRDGIFLHTIFIAPDIASVMSSSVMGKNAQALSIYLSNKEAIRAMMREYGNFLELCKPLSLHEQGESFGRKILASMPSAADSLFVQYPFSAYAMHDGLSIGRLAGNGIDRISQWLDLVEDQLRAGMTVWNALPRLSIDECVRLQEKMSTEERKKLNGLVLRMRGLVAQYQNYHLLVLRPELLPYAIAVIRGHQVFVAKDIESPSVFHAREQTAVEAFWDYYTYLIVSEYRKDESHTALLNNLLSVLQ